MADKDTGPAGTTGPKDPPTTQTQNTDTGAPDTEITPKKKGAKNEPPPQIKAPPKHKDLGGKGWAEIMSEMFDLPSGVDQINWARETGQALLNKSKEMGAQRDLFAAAERYIKDPINNRPVEGAPCTDKDGNLSLAVLVEGWGPNGKKIENAVEINNKREATEGKWRIDKNELKKIINDEIVLKEKAIDVMAIGEEERKAAKLEARKAANEELKLHQSPTELTAARSKAAAEKANADMNTAKTDLSSAQTNYDAAYQKWREAEAKLKECQAKSDKATSDHETARSHTIEKREERNAAKTTFITAENSKNQAVTESFSQKENMISESKISTKLTRESAKANRAVEKAERKHEKAKSRLNQEMENLQKANEDPNMSDADKETLKGYVDKKKTLVSEAQENLKLATENAVIAKNASEDQKITLREAKTVAEKARDAINDATIRQDKASEHLKHCEENVRNADQRENVTAEARAIANSELKCTDSRTESHELTIFCE